MSDYTSHALISTGIGMLLLYVSLEHIHRLYQ